MTIASPLRGPKSTEGGGFAAAHFQRAAQATGPPLRPKGATAARHIVRLRLIVDIVASLMRDTPAMLRELNVAGQRYQAVLPAADSHGRNGFGCPRKFERHAGDAPRRPGAAGTIDV